MSGRSETEVQLGTIALLNTLESGQTLGGLRKTAKAKVFKTNDALVGDTCQIHRVVPHIKIVLQPLLVGHEAGNTRRIILIRWQTENLESFAGHLGTRILHTIGSTSRHLAGNHHPSALADGFLIPRNLYGSNHRLTGIAKATRRTVIEHIPLAIDQLQGTMCVMTGIRSHQVRTVFIHHHTTTVD